jgi:SpoVK/Ycf46/Vps4 family AAA+-type ATPase
MLIEIEEPDENTRKEILKLYFKERVKEFDLDSVAKKTEGFSGAFIKELYSVYMLNSVKIEDAIERLRKHMKTAEKGNSSDDDAENYVG